MVDCSLRKQQSPIVYPTVSFLLSAPLIAAVFKMIVKEKKTEARFRETGRVNER